MFILELIKEVGMESYFIEFLETFYREGYLENYYPSIKKVKNPNFFIGEKNQIIISHDKGERSVNIIKLNLPVDFYHVVTEGEEIRDFFVRNKENISFSGQNRKLNKLNYFNIGDILFNKRDILMIEIITDAVVFNVPLRNIHI